MFVYIYFDDSNEGKKLEETVALANPALHDHLQTKPDSLKANHELALTLENKLKIIKLTQ